MLYLNVVVTATINKVCKISVIDSIFIQIVLLRSKVPNRRNPRPDPSPGGGKIRLLAHLRELRCASSP